MGEDFLSLFIHIEEKEEAEFQVPLKQSVALQQLLDKALIHHANKESTTSML